MNQLGNTSLLSIRKTAFLCSRSISSTAVLKCYDWAITQRDRGNCIISGFQSQIEKDVLHYLLQGKQPIIVALARGLKKHLERDLEDALAANRLLLISPFEDNVKRATTETAEKRNRMMIEIADEIVFGFITENGNLSNLKKEYENIKPIRIL